MGRNRDRALVNGLMLGVLVLGGCTSNDTPDAAPWIDAHPRPDAQAAVTVDAGTSDARVFADAAPATTGPQNVRVISPTAGAVVLTSLVAVVCHAESNAISLSPVLSVKLTATDVANHTESAVGSSSDVSEWSASLSLAGFSNGTLNIECQATAANGASTTSNAIVWLDLGPKVAVSQPVANGAVHGNISIDFTVVPAPLSNPDPPPGSAVTSVTASIAAKNITLTAATATHYQALVRADDAALFGHALDGPQTMTVVATDARGATRLVKVWFTVDNTPPAIAITSPLPATLIGGVITVVATVNDDSGIDPNTVVAVIGNGSTALATFPLSPQGASFTGTYDTKLLRALVEQTYGASFDLVFPTLSVRARDLAGNEGSYGEVTIMDYTPPIVSLTSPKVREGRFDSILNAIDCSIGFPPLGFDAVVDKQSVPQLSSFRARIFDRGNSRVTTSRPLLILKAGVEDASVQIFFLDHTNNAGIGDALVVDTDGDGKCDDINPMLRPTTLPQSANDALAVNLVPIPPTGNSWFLTADPAGYAGYPECAQAGVISDWPRGYCLRSTGLQRAIGDPFDKTIPQIYGMSSVANGYCAGMPFDSLANNIQDGWACVAVRAVDKLGNVGVSKPIRVCFNHDGTFAACPPYPLYKNPTSEDIPPDLSPMDPTFPILGAQDPDTFNPVLDCLGTYTPPTVSTPASTNPNGTCTTVGPPASELLRID